MSEPTKKKTHTRRGIAGRAAWALCMISLLFSQAKAADPPAKKGLDEETIKIFKEHGAVYGGFVKDPQSNFRVFKEGADAATKGIPGFKMAQLGQDEGNSLPALPDVDAPFGIDLTGSHISNASWEELVPQKQLVLLRLDSTNTSDEALKELARIKSLTSLSLHNCRISTKGIVDLLQSESLKEVRVDSNLITNEFLHSLANSKSLHKICVFAGKDGAFAESDEKIQTANLSESKIGDAGLKDLASLGNLKSLKARSTGITDTGLKTIGEFSRLESLDLAETKTTDAGLKALKQESTLLDLNLSGAKITNSGIKSLANFHELRTLILDDTAANDAAVADLKTLKKLKTLSLKNTVFTNKGIGELKAAMKGVDIAYSKDVFNDEALAAVAAEGKLYANSRAAKFRGVKPKSEEDVDSFDLSNSRVTDEGLKSLAGLKNSSRPVNPILRSVIRFSWTHHPGELIHGARQSQSG